MRKLNTLTAPMARLYQPPTLHPLLTPQRGERSPACLLLLYEAHRRVRRGAIGTLCVSSLAVWLLLGMAGVEIAAASHTSTDPATVGELGPLIPFHKDAIHAALLWTKKTSPKVCFWMRPSEYRGSDLVDSTLIDSSNPSPLSAALRPEFAELVYGFDFSTGPHGLDESVATRILADIPRDNGLCFDPMHPAAFKNTGKFNVADLTKADFALNAAAFVNAGHSRGLQYNIFCSGNVALSDGRLLFVGGHDASGNIGIKKINIFDPQTLSWVPRPVPPVKADFLADPTGSQLLNPDPLDVNNTDPPHPSDMQYARWYPSAVTLPDGRVLILSGTHEEKRLGPPGTQFAPCPSLTANAACSKVRQVVPEVYDPATDTTIALENARKKFMMYAPTYVVQTGPRKDDWMVAVSGEVEPPEPGLETIGQYDPWTYNGNTYYLDVLGALKDPNRHTPAENHWYFLDRAVSAHDSGAGAHLLELDDKGWAISQKVVLFGGGCGASPPRESCDGRTVEIIDYQASNPQWARQDNLIQEASQNNAVPLPTGKVLIFGGAVGRAECGESVWNNSFHYQIFDPGEGSITPLVETTVPRHDHATGLLLPNATVIAMGGNRTDLANDPCHPGLDIGVPVAQLYKPPYFFSADRPVIEWAPRQIPYGGPFVVKVSGGSGKIGSVAIIRQDPQTHNWGWGNRYVKLWHKEIEGGWLIIQAPAVPGLAVPGYYMLFAISEEGVPSVANLVQLQQWWSVLKEEGAWLDHHQ
jgi:Domain of unknown function (DUF1929)